MFLWCLEMFISTHILQNTTFLCSVECTIMFVDPVWTTLLLTLIIQTPVHYKINELWIDILVNMVHHPRQKFPILQQIAPHILSVTFRCLYSFCLAIRILGFWRGSKLGSSAVEIRPSHENIMMSVKRPMTRIMAAIQ